MELDKEILEKFLEYLSIKYDKYDFSEIPDSVKIALMNALALEGDLVPEEEEIVESIFDKISRNFNKIGNVLIENWKPIALGLAIVTVVLYHSNKNIAVATKINPFEETNQQFVVEETEPLEEQNPDHTSKIYKDFREDPSLNFSNYYQNTEQQQLNSENSLKNPREFLGGNKNVRKYNSLFDLLINRKIDPINPMDLIEETDFQGNFSKSPENYQNTEQPNSGNSSGISRKFLSGNQNEKLSEESKNNKWFNRKDFREDPMFNFTELTEDSENAKNVSNRKYHNLLDPLRNRKINLIKETEIAKKIKTELENRIRPNQRNEFEKEKEKTRRHKENKFLEGHLKNKTLLEEDKEKYIKTLIRKEIQPDTWWRWVTETEEQKAARIKKNNSLNNILDNKLLLTQFKQKYLSNEDFPKKFADYLLFDSRIHKTKIDQAVIDQQKETDLKAANNWVNGMIAREHSDQARQELENIKKTPEKMVNKYLAWKEEPGLFDYLEGLIFPTSVGIAFYTYKAYTL